MTSFGSSFRLKNSHEFSAVFDNKRCNQSNCFKVFHKENYLTNSRLGLVVSKKVLPRSVDRNSLKRVIRESFRKHEMQSNDYVVLPNKKVRNKSSNELSLQLSKLWYVKSK